jgi:hypothetical protein
MYSVTLFIVKAGWKAVQVKNAYGELVWLPKSQMVLERGRYEDNVEVVLSIPDWICEDRHLSVD